LLSHAALFLGNDSFLAHCAGSFDNATVELMNHGVSEKRWRALGKKTVVVSGYNPDHICQYDQEQFPCPHMLAITAEEVGEAIKRATD
jgi:ADP-heptose:LPS heptosyltransferase